MSASGSEKPAALAANVLSISDAATSGGDEQLSASAKPAATEQNVSTADSTVGQTAKEKGSTPDERLAPYYPYEGIPMRVNHYYVHLKKDYTMKKHWEFLGEELGLECGEFWYEASLTDEQLLQVRRDPGVERVRKSGAAVWG